MPPVSVWSYGRRATSTFLTVYAMRMAAVFTISTTSIFARLGLAPRWLVVLGYATAAVLLVSSGLLPWLEILFPAWVLVLSVHILVATRPRPGLTPSSGGVVL